MEGIVVLLVLFGLWLLIGPIVALVKAGSAQDQAKEARDQLQGLLGRIKALEIDFEVLFGNAFRTATRRYNDQNFH